MKATVAIPTKNPGAEIREVIEAVRVQDTAWPFEIVVVDSGSTDGTREWLAAAPDVRLEEIDPRTFGHGRTRNQAVRWSEGEFIAFLTHDAVPAHKHWLANLVAAVEQDPKIAGAFGRHLPKDDASPFVRRDLEAHFAGFAALPSVVSRDTDPDRYHHDQGWRQVLHFFSDNNACIRRSVWEQIPYPDVEFAEDQIWAARIIEAGWAKAYADDAPVYHSHDYALAERLRRSFDEANAFRELFGYRLCAGPYALLRSFAGLAMRDVRHARHAGLPATALVRQVMQLGAMLTGHLLGSYGHRLPKGVATRLSQDKRLFRSLTAST